MFLPGFDVSIKPGTEQFAASRSHTFAQFADAIDLAFARWDLAHMHMFTMAGQAQITPLELWDGEAPEGSIDSDRTKLSRLGGGAQFAYVFDFGDDWAHLCTVAESRIDPVETLGGVPAGPMPYFGWGDVPDQYGRRWDGDGESPPPKPPRRPLAELPPLLPWWGPRQRGQ